MSCEVAIGLIVISILVLALVGLITIIRAFFPKPRPPSSIESAWQVAEELYASQAISESAFVEMISALEQAKLPPHLRSATPRRPAVPTRPLAPPTEQPARAEIIPVSPATGSPGIDRPAQTSGAGTVVSQERRPPVLAKSTPGVVEPSAPRQVVPRPPRPATATSPWDLPDEPEKPSKSWREVFALFMQEKNIRWGELASGILIVGSAVGLVLSLRSQLLQVIPYFPALLFLLITAAIIASGVYTLRRWRLQMTSRGILVIGLLLIPLNVLIGCWLTGNKEFQRPLNDPVYWIAIGIELISLAALTVWGAKHLLRGYYWGVVAAIISCAAYTLFVNRIPDPSASTLRTAFWMSPFALFFLLGLAGIAPRMSVRMWSGREIRRLLANLGVTFFAVAVGVSLFFIKWPAGSLAIGASPMVVAMAIATSWLGGLILSRPRRPTESRRLIALTLKVMGLLLTGAGIVIAQAHPLLGLITTLLAALLFAIQSRLERSAWMMLPAAVCLVWGVAAGTMLFSSLGSGPGLDQLTTVGHFFHGLVGAKTGIAILLASLLTGFSFKYFFARFADSSNPEFRVAHFALHVGMAVLGVLLAVAASFLHPQNRFDVFAATALLAAIGIALLAATVARRPDKTVGKWTAHAGTGFLFAAVAHGFWWNGTIHNRLAEAFGWFAPYPIALAAFGLLMAVAGALYVWATPPDERNGEWDAHAACFRVFAIGAGLTAWIFAIPLVSAEQGTGSGIALALVVAWWLLVWAKSSPLERVGFALSSAVAALFVCAEFGIRLDWFEDWSEVRFPLVCLAALGVWSLPWVALRRVNRSSAIARFVCAEKEAPDGVVAIGLAVVGSLLIGFGLLAPICAEIANQSNAALPAWVNIVSEWRWLAAVLAISAVAVLVQCLERLTSSRVESLALIWFAGWGLASVVFADAIATASALRWSMAVCGLLLSLMVAYRHGIGRFRVQVGGALGFKPTLELDGSRRMVIVHAGLAVAVAVILGITAVVTTAVMVNSGRGIGGPNPNSLFGRLPKDISYAVPIAILVATCLSYAISLRRQWLAMVGSFVFQACVVGSLILLSISSDPRIASVRFIQILQFVSIGMSIYGAVWFWQRRRIRSAGESAATGSLLAVHSIVNTVLMVGLTAIIFTKFYGSGRIDGQWIQVIGGPIGILAVATLIPVFLATVPSAMRRFGLWSIAIFGSMVVGIAAIHADKLGPYGLVTIALGMDLVLAIQILGKWLGRDASVRSGPTYTLAGMAWRAPQWESMSLLLVGGLAYTFCFRGLPTHTGESFAALVVLGVLVLVYGFAFVSGNGLLFGYFLAAASIDVFWAHRTFFAPMIPPPVETRFQLIVLAFLTVTLLTQVFGLARTRHARQVLPRSFSCWPNLIAVLGSVVMSLSVIYMTLWWQWGGIVTTTNFQMIGVALLIAISGLQLWNVRAQFVVPTLCFTSFAAVWLGTYLLFRDEVEIYFVVGTALLPVVWGLVRWHRERLIAGMRALRFARPASLKSRLERQIPRMVWGFAVPILLVCLIAVGFQLAGRDGAEFWSRRLQTALLPSILGVAFYFLAGRPVNETRQLVSALLFTGGAILLSWIDLGPAEVSIPILILRSLTILAAAVFLFGWLVPSLVRRGDSWLATLRRMTIFTTVSAIGALSVLLAFSFASPSDTLSASDAGRAMLAVIAMVSGLVAIAVRPKHDPFSFSISHRTGLVYAAQAASILGIIFASRTIPWLFQLGLRHYWPYLLMGVSIGGLMLAKLLERRELNVLGQPLLNLAMTIPLAGVAGTMWGTTKTDPSLVIFAAGAVYFLVSVVQRSMLASVAALVFGNWALYCFYDKFPHFRFVEHPQLWLIPPAISLLIALQFNRKRLGRAELALLRYAALGTIYVSSTSEIFISQVGDQLWPPIVLAMLSLGGIFMGILIQARAFLYVGSLFLLISMISMVMHASQRLDHVWPWWAFGICMGIAILVLFGLFEKRRNDFRRVATHLQSWDL